MVSVWMVTYNHGAYIRKAIESVMMQKTTFPFKLYIGEDCSTDDTAAICIEYKNKFPEKIELFLNPKNLGASLNAMQVYDACFNSGAKYIALLDGDDYWSDPLKLQKQVDALEIRPDCSICFTNLATLIESEQKFVQNCLKINPTRTLDVYDLTKQYIYTSTVLFRNKIKKLPDWMLGNIGGDTTLFLLLSEDGSKAFFLPEETTVYREHTGGIFSGRNSFPYEKRKQIELGMVHMIGCWMNHFGNDQKLYSIFKKSKFGALNKLRVIGLENADNSTVRSASFKMLTLFPTDVWDIKLWASIILSLLIPSLHNKWISKKTR